MSKEELLKSSAASIDVELLQKHLVDTIALCKSVEISQISNLIDIVTGSRFPGVPLKIAYPHLKLTLLDSLQKRIKFLNEVVNQLGLSDVETIHGRAEDFAKPSMKRESYDVCVSRAVANLASLSEYCLPYVKVGG